MTSANSVDNARHTLVSIVQQDCIFFTYKFSKLLFQLLMKICITTHHACAHRSGKTIVRSGFSVCFAHLGVIGESEIIIKAPNNFFLSTKQHSAADISFQFRKREISMCSFTVLTDWSVILEES